MEIIVPQPYHGQDVGMSTGDEQDDSDSDIDEEQVVLNVEPGQPYEREGWTDDADDVEGEEVVTGDEHEEHEHFEHAHDDDDEESDDEDDDELEIHVEEDEEEEDEEVIGLT